MEADSDLGGNLLSSALDIIFTVLKYSIFGFFGLILVLIVLALLFGRRVRKQWEYEAEFRDETGREFGEFEIESSRIEKQQAGFTVKARFYLRHPGLQAQQTVQVFLDDTLVMEGHVQEAGQIRLGNDHLHNVPDQVQAGQQCRIVIDTTELASASLVRD